MSALELFRYQDRDVRTVVVGGAPWFVAADVCGVLEIADPKSSVRLLDDDEKGVQSMHTPGGYQHVSVINEPGLYSLILRSRKPEAKAFKRWITHEVLPAIRHTGSFGAPAQPLDVVALARQLVAEADRADTAERALASSQAQLSDVRRALGVGAQPTPAAVRVRPETAIVEEWVRRSTVAGSTPGRQLYRAFTNSTGAVMSETMFGLTLTHLGFTVRRIRGYHHRPLALPTLWPERGMMSR